MLTCPFCGSHRIETIGGDYGNPFDRREEKEICMDCGRTMPHQSVDVNPFDRRKENLYGLLADNTTAVDRCQPICSACYKGCGKSGGRRINKNRRNHCSV